MTAPEAPPQQMAPSRVPPIVRSLGWVSFFTDMGSEMIHPLLPGLLRSLGGSAVWPTRSSFSRQSMHAVTGLAVLPANLIFGLLYNRHASLAFGASAASAAVAALLLLVMVKEPQSATGSGTLST